MWKIVAADDEGYIREALEKLIDWEKMNCCLKAVVGDGEQLIEEIQKDVPDLVITDIQMPGMSGLQVCRYIYETCPEIPVILLTAYSDFEYARSAIRYNVCDYVLKLAIMEELPKAVEKAIRGLEAGKKELEKREETEPLFVQIEQYIEQNYQRKISLGEMALALHANGSYLSRLYKNKTGTNLFDAILDRKMEAAKELLSSTEMRTYEISEAVGIEDSGYFSKMFKKKTGYSPKEYRKLEKTED